MPSTAHRLGIGLVVLGLLGGLARDAGAQRSKELGIPWWIYVGTYTGPESKGIYLFQMKTSENPDIPEFVTMTPLGLVAETPNPIVPGGRSQAPGAVCGERDRQLPGQEVRSGQRVRRRLRGRES